MGFAKAVSLAQYCSHIVYLDGLLDSLHTSGHGCYWEDHFPGALCYADDLTILAPSSDALRKMLALCENHAQAHGTQFTADKTQPICFRRTAASDRTHFSLCGQCLPMIQSFTLRTLCSIICLISWIFI